MSRFAARAGAFRAPPAKEAADEGATTRAIFHTLASAAAIEAAESQAAALAAVQGGGAQQNTIPCSLLARYLEVPAVPGIGANIVRVAFGEQPAISFSAFLRGIEALTSGSGGGGGGGGGGGATNERLLQHLFEVLCTPINDDDVDAVAAVTRVFERAYRLQSGQTRLPSDSAVAFRSAASSAAIEMNRRDGPIGRRFGAWAGATLPGLASLLGRHVERLCDASEGLDAAAQLQALAQRKRGVTNAVGKSLKLDELLGMSPDAARRMLRASQSTYSAAIPPARSSTSAAAAAAGAINVSDDLGGGGGGGGGGGDGGGDGSNRGSGQLRPLVGPAYLWLLSHALTLPDAAEPDRWTVLFSSISDGRSLHTLGERISGYAHGSLLLVRDTAGFVFAGYAAKGFNPSPPSATAPPRDPDFTGSESAALIRLFP